VEKALIKAGFKVWIDTAITPGKVQKDKERESE
jgi:hypothetical protein